MDNDQQLPECSTVFTHIYCVLLLHCALLCSNWKRLKVLLKLKRNHSTSHHVRRRRYIQCPASHVLCSPPTPMYPSQPMRPTPMYPSQPMRPSPMYPSQPMRPSPAHTWPYQFYVIPLLFIPLPIPRCPTHFSQVTRQLVHNVQKSMFLLQLLYMWKDVL